MSLTFIDNNQILITEKPGSIKLLNVSENVKNIKHNLKILEDGQGGLLDILFHENTVFVTYSENRLNDKSSTS